MGSFEDIFSRGGRGKLLKEVAVEAFGQNAGKFVDGMREVFKPIITLDEQAKFKKSESLVRIKKEKRTVQPGELLVVRYVEDSEVTVSAGAKFEAVKLIHSRVRREPGGTVEVYELADDYSEVVDVIPAPDMPKKCSHCGAPQERRNRRQCDYCGSMSF